MLEKTRALYAQRAADMATKLCPMSEGEVAYITTIFNICMDQGSCTPVEAVKKVCEFLSLPTPAIPEDAAKPGAPREAALEAFVEIRRKELEPRTYREKLRSTLVALSADGATLDFDALLEGMMEEDEEDAEYAPAAAAPSTAAPAGSPKASTATEADKAFMREQARKAKLAKMQKILLYAFLYDKLPTNAKGELPTDDSGDVFIPRPADAEGKPLPLLLPIDTFLENYFMDKYVTLK